MSSELLEKETDTNSYETKVISGLNKILFEEHPDIHHEIGGALEEFENKSIRHNDGAWHKIRELQYGNGTKPDRFGRNANSLIVKVPNSKKRDLGNVILPPDQLRELISIILESPLKGYLPHTECYSIQLPPDDSTYAILQKKCDGELATKKLIIEKNELIEVIRKINEYNKELMEKHHVYPDFIGLQSFSKTAHYVLQSLFPEFFDCLRSIDTFRKKIATIFKKNEKEKNDSIIPPTSLEIDFSLENIFVADIDGNISIELPDIIPLPIHFPHERDIVEDRKRYIHGLLLYLCAVYQDEIFSVILNKEFELRRDNNIESFTQEMKKIRLKILKRFLDVGLPCLFGGPKFWIEAMRLASVK